MAMNHDRMNAFFLCLGVLKMKFVKTFCLAALLSLSCAVPVLADCTYPKKPSDPPNGAKTTQEEMVAAMKITKQYDVDVKSYLNCLDTETDSLVNALGADAKPEAVQQVKNKQNLKHNAAIDDLQKYADTFNLQLRAFKAK